MAYSYDRTAAIDPSILGYTESELRDMDDEERKEALVESLNRAADLAEQVVEAFKKDLGPKQREVMSAARALMQVARALD